MSTCKDCLHYEVCVYWCDSVQEIFETKTYIPFDDNNNDYCQFFKPKADYVAVVRCKDCKHWERLYYRPFVEPRNDGRCKALWQFHDAERNITFEDHFCGYGEKESEVKE